MEKRGRCAHEDGCIEVACCGKSFDVEDIELIVLALPGNDWAEFNQTDHSYFGWQFEHCEYRPIPELSWQINKRPR